MVAEPSQVSVSRADVFHCFPKAMVWLAQAFPLAAHTSCQMPWSWSATSTVHANVSPVSGFKASVPRYIGQAVEPVEPVIAHRCDEHATERVPYHGSCRVSVRVGERIQGSLHILPVQIGDLGQGPGRSAIGRVVEALVT